MRGILIFVPSNDIISSINLPNSHRDTKGRSVRIFSEKRANDKKIAEENDPDILSEENRSVLQAYRNRIAINKKTVLIGVLGGKLSEGTDFKGDQCRMCIVLGIPYPILNPITKIKKNYYN